MALLVIQLFCLQVVKVPRRFRTIEMARRLENWSQLEVRVVIRFLWTRIVSASDIHSQIVEVYSEEAMSRQHVAKWCRSFQSGRQDVENRTMAVSGRASSSKTENNTAQVEEMIQNDRRVCARWVPRALSDEHKATRMMCSHTFLQRYHSDGRHFIDHIVTGDKTWLHHFVPTSKKVEWKHPGSPATKKFKVTPSAGKVMATIFWDSCGVIPLDYLERGQTIHADHYSATLTRIQEGIRRKRPGMLSEGVILLHDNG
ncbi:histone-lysine N-methyltransferase SETMAR [Caerostris darwini]|uniref:Histone-lysine N-methyltransferase SETMAR n=1 Tax=Caerostris darwini TaxID=1538125 RepID=A0AAV4PAK4_9ARAC|nr:histone-lysine N-methyltransferase SETMAR [Caerostris darwini]